MTMDLDSRARSAASALRRSVEGLEPLADVPAARRPRRGVALMAAAAVVAVAVGIYAAVQWSDGGDDVGVVAAAPGEVPHLVPAGVPQGLALGAAIDLPVDDDDSGDVSLRLYGRGSADDPFADGDLGVFVAAPGVIVPDDVTPAVAVHGRGAEFAWPEVGPTTLYWTEPDGTYVGVASHAMSDDELAAAAEDLSLTDGQVDGVPDGFAPVALYADAHVLHREGLPVSPDTGGYSVSYGTDGGERYLAVASHKDDGAHLQVLRWWYRARPVEVRGHDGVLGSTEDQLVLSWLEAPGVVVTMSARGISEDELLAVAESLRAVSAEEWAALQDEPAIAGGELQDGSWRLYASDDRSLCLEVTGPSATEASCSNPVAADAVAQIRLDLATGTHLLADLDAIPAEGDLDIVAVVPLDAEGNELARFSLSGPDLGRTTTIVSDGSLLEGAYNGDTWRLTGGSGDDLCVGVKVEFDVTVATCGAAPFPVSGLGELHWYDASNWGIVFGRTAADVAAVHVDGEQSRLLGTSEGWGVFAAPLSDRFEEVEVVARNADGDVVDQEVVAIAGA